MALLTSIARKRRGPAIAGRHIAWLIGLALLCSAAPGVAADTAPTAEYQLKAVFLFKFAQFVRWPANAFREPAAPLVIGVLGDDPFGTFLDDEVVRGEKIDGHPLIVRRYRQIEDVTECHFLFISRSEAGALEKVVAHLKGRSVLTVGDFDTFTRQGGMVRLVTENGKIRFEINNEAAKACEVTISSKLLSLATIVTSGKD